MNRNLVLFSGAFLASGVLGLLMFQWMRSNVSPATAPDQASLPPGKPTESTVRSKSEEEPVVERPPPPDFLLARRRFTTKLFPPPPRRKVPADVPPAGVFRRVHYPSPLGNLVAYVTPDPGDGRKHPAVLWCHGGFFGIASYLWEPAPPSNDQSARAFREAGLLLMCPSWRGENDNPGRYEMFFGEVDDLLAAVDYLAKLPYVDPDRIYLAGHSTGGTMALLGAIASPKFRAAFSFGGSPDIAHLLQDGKGFGNTPFDYRSQEECRIRSPLHFAEAIRCPTYYFEGVKSFYPEDAQRMEAIARATDRPFSAIIVDNADHFNILHSITRLVANKLVQDTGPTCKIKLTHEEVQGSFDRRRR